MLIFHYTDHKKKWDWLSKNPGKDRLDWFNAEFSEEWVTNWIRDINKSYDPINCDACTIKSRLEAKYEIDDSECKYCPLDADTQNDLCLNGLHSEWRIFNDQDTDEEGATNFDPIKAKELAEKIRDFPLKPKEWFEEHGVEII